MFLNQQAAGLGGILAPGWAKASSIRRLRSDQTQPPSRVHTPHSFNSPSLLSHSFHHVCHQATARLDRSPAPSGTPTVKQCLLSKNIQPLVPLGIKIAICLSKWLWSHTLVVVGGRDFTSSWFQSTCHLHVGSLPT